MSPIPFGPRSSTKKPSIVAALAQLAAWEQSDLTPAEEDSAHAAGAISNMLSLMSADAEDPVHVLQTKLERLKALREALENPDTTEHHAGKEIRLLVEFHHGDISRRVAGYIAEAKLLISSAGPI